MFRYNNQFTQTPPATVEYKGFKRKFADLTREQWDEIGWNEAFPVKREAFTTYETRWVKDVDLIYREKVVSAVVDEAAKAEHEAAKHRSRRDSLLAMTDWTQLKDTTLDDTGTVLWQSYRQALRDLPQQPGFPLYVEWPVQPVIE